MATADRPPANGAPPGRATDIAPRRSDRSPWNWLLLVAVVVPLIVPIFNGRSPHIYGFPLFYWLQMGYIVLGVAITYLVYRMTRRSPAERAAAERAAQRDIASSQGRDGLVAPDEEA